MVKIYVLVFNWEKFWKSGSKVNSLKNLPRQMQRVGISEIKFIFGEKFNHQIIEIRF